MQNTLTISDEGIALIKQFEGFSPVVYFCPAGKPTIGYGHVTNGARRPAISEADASALLLTDLNLIIPVLNQLITVQITQNQFDALCSLTYNIGIGNFGRSTLLKLLNSGKPASAQFLRWIYGAGNPIPGLIARRQAEKELFEKP